MACIWKVFMEVNVWRNALFFSHSIWWKHVTQYWSQFQACQTLLLERPNCASRLRLWQWIWANGTVPSEAPSRAIAVIRVITVTRHSDVSKVHGRIIPENWCKLAHVVLFLCVAGLVFWLAHFSLIAVEVVRVVSELYCRCLWMHI